MVSDLWLFMGAQTWRKSSLNECPVSSDHYRLEISEMCRMSHSLF